tara:strand:- start:148 stop:465 length:318 start_codon:yes stop_codon:yes gene_type:complete
MLRANLTTDGGVPIGYIKSEFYTLTSTGVTDFQPLDLSGSREVMVIMQAGSTLNGKITNEPFAGSDGMTILSTMTQPLVFHSTDDRLYWVSADAADAVLLVWVIR